MKTRFILIVVGLCIFSAAVGFAQNKCTPETIKGVYAVTCSGWVAPGPGAPLVPYAGQGVVTTTVVGKDAVIHGSADLSIGGNQIPAQFGAVNAEAGDVTVNSNCTGRVVYNKTDPASRLDINFIVLDQGKELRGFVQNPGFVVTCSLRLMTRETNPE